MSEFRKAAEAAMATGDPQPIFDALADDVVFSSPVVFKPYEGKAAVSAILAAVTRVFTDFRYEHELRGEGGMHALIFRAQAGGREVQGLDLVRERDGKVVELTVMARPLSGLTALGGAMREELERAGVI